MAENDTSKVILDVEISMQDSIKRIAELKDSVSALKQQQEALKKANLENSEEYVVIGEKIKALNKAIASNSKDVQDNIKMATNAVGSYNHLSAELARLKDAYHAAGTDDEREAILKNLKDVNDQLVQLDEAQGVYVRNVGNYKSAIEGLLPGFDQINKTLGAVGLDISDISKNLSNGLSKVGSSLSNLTKAVASGDGVKAAFADAGTAVKAFGKTLLASPIGWIAAAIAALVAIFSKLSDAIKKNDEAGTNFARLFDALQPIIDLVTKAFAGLADILGKVAGALADFASALSGATASAEALTVAMDNLEEMQRKYAENSAKRNRDIARLEDEANDKENYTADERRKRLQQAVELARKNLEEQQAIAAENLRILEETAKRERDTSDETANKIAEARAAMYKAEEDYYTGTKQLNKKIQSLNTEIQADEDAKRKAANDAYKKRIEERIKAAEDAAAKEKDLLQQVADMSNALIADETERAIAERRTQGEREIDELKNRLANESNLTAAARDALATLIMQKEIVLENDIAKIREDAANQQAKADADAIAERIQKEEQAADARAQFGIDAEKTEEEQELAAAKAAYDDRLLTDEEYEQAKTNIAAKYAKIAADNEVAEAQKAMQKKIESVNQYAQAAESITSSMNDLLNNLSDAQMDKYTEQNDEKKAALEERLNSGLISQEQYDKETAELDADLEKKQKEADLKSAKREKAIALMKAIVDTALGIAKAVSESPMTGGLPGSAIMAATGAAQIAAIAAEPLPTAGKGMLINGASHANGGVLINAEGGEAIINKRATKRYLPLLSAINQSTGGVRLYGNGGTVTSAVNNPSSVFDYGKLAVALSQMNVSVAVTDINRGQSNYAKVESLRTF